MQLTVPFGVVIHGGSGIVPKKEMTADREAAYRETLSEALSKGYEILRNEGSSLDAIVEAVVILEDSPLFNAGKGAKFTSSGTNELDASIMDGKTLKAGAVAAVKHIKNPICLARLVMEKSQHVMMIGDGAEAFAHEYDVEFVTEDYFYTDSRWKELQGEKDTGKQHGTVGAVALDKAGNLASGTSTGGMTNKRFGRVGDSPIIGAGTYANNETCAVSCTGHGEYFMRTVAAYDISALMAYGGMTLTEAAETLVTEKLVNLGGWGGVVAIDKSGQVAMPFNTEGMYRGYAVNDGKIVAKIYDE